MVNMLYPNAPEASCLVLGLVTQKEGMRLGKGHWALQRGHTVKVARKEKSLFNSGLAQRPILGI